MVALEYILEYTIPPNRISKNGEPRMLFLTVITTLETQGYHAASEPTYFKTVSSCIKVWI
jgi:hypothetical protein